MTVEKRLVVGYSSEISGDLKTPANTLYTSLEECENCKSWGELDGWEIAELVEMACVVEEGDSRIPRMPALKAAVSESDPGWNGELMQRLGSLSTKNARPQYSCSEGEQLRVGLRKLPECKTSVGTMANIRTRVLVTRNLAPHIAGAPGYYFGCIRGHGSRNKCRSTPNSTNLAAIDGFADGIDLTWRAKLFPSNLSRSRTLNGPELENNTAVAGNADVGTSWPEWRQAGAFAWFTVEISRTRSLLLYGKVCTALQLRQGILVQDRAGMVLIQEFQPSKRRKFQQSAGELVQKGSGGQTRVYALYTSNTILLPCLLNRTSYLSNKLLSPRVGKVK
ncbi:hypothetical protein B0H13DRAFT_1918091 [Mycena leptocephala]|nr:hypothetical protein B0H13DRAFT_1918091 [Mycena leptocephala]